MSETPDVIEGMARKICLNFGCGYKDDICGSCSDCKGAARAAAAVLLVAVERELEAHGEPQALHVIRARDRSQNPNGTIYR